MKTKSKFLRKCLKIVCTAQSALQTRVKHHSDGKDTSKPKEDSALRAITEDRILSSSLLPTAKYRWSRSYTKALQSFADCTFDASRLQKAQAFARIKLGGRQSFPNQIYNVRSCLIRRQYRHLHPLSSRFLHSLLCRSGRPLAKSSSREEREREFEPKHNSLHWKPNNFGSKPTKTTKETIRYSKENGKLQTRLQNGKH